jgi:hypothetical protein
MKKELKIGDKVRFVYVNNTNDFNDFELSAIGKISAISNNLIELCMVYGVTPPSNVLAPMKIHRCQVVSVLRKKKMDELWVNIYPDSINGLYVRDMFMCKQDAEDFKKPNRIGPPVRYVRSKR